MKKPGQQQASRASKITMTIFVSALFLTAIAISIGIYVGKTGPAESVSSLPEVLVYKSPTCGCCKKWITHLEESGFTVKSIDEPDMNQVKQIAGVPHQYQSCHTAKVAGYYIEGHVPAADVKRLLRQKPDAKGLAVPGMPMGSPGMEGYRKDNYAVLLIDQHDAATVYESY